MKPVSKIFILKNTKWIGYGILLMVILIVSLLFFSNKKEAFTTSPNTTKKLDPNTTTNNLTYLATTWDPETVYNYLITQKTNNDHIIYDPLILQQNATQEEANYFLKNNHWPWSQETKDQYIQALNQNKIMRTYPKDSLNINQKIYPEKTVQELLAFDAPEGQFVLNDIIVNKKQNEERAFNKGMGIFGFTSGLLNPESNQILGCRKLTNDKTDEPYLIVPSKGTYSQVNPKARKLDYAEIPNLVDGFEFTNQPCNPCGILNQPADYSCRFKINKDKVEFVQDSF